MTQKFRKPISWLLSLAMLVTMLPNIAFTASAVDVDSLHEHHIEHTVDCDHVKNVSTYTTTTTETDSCTHASYINGFCVDCGAYESAVENADKIYEISNAGQLFWFAQQVNAGNQSLNAILMADIDLENRAWSPLGTHNDNDSSQNCHFKGTFDGNYHIVKNLSVVVDDSCEAGFFGRAESATIKNFGIVNASVEGNGGSRVGVIGGELHKCSVTNVFSAGDITLTSSHAQQGGIAGECASATLEGCFTTYGTLSCGTPTSLNYCYYQADSENTSSNGEYKTAAQFASGEVAYLLNGSSSTGVWKQTIGMDSLPNFTSSDTVYGYYTTCDEAVGMSYTNNASSATPTTRPEHTIVDGKCSACGVDCPHKAYENYVCTVCGAACPHDSYSNGVCTVCNYTCTHDNDTSYINGFCVYCDTYQSAVLNADGTYEIENAGQLYWFAAQVNSGKKAINGKLTADIKVNENVLVNGNLNSDTSSFRTWTPIGSNSNKYSGTFDGNGKTISGLYYNNSSNQYVGLFGYLYGPSTVQNVGVVESYFCGGGTQNGGGTAGIAAYSVGTIKNCYNTSMICGNYSVGGIVGNASSGSVTQCYNTGSITGYNSYVGGVLGRSYNATISNCYNTGTVTGPEITRYVGGFAGRIAVHADYAGTYTVSYCYNAGAVNPKISKGSSFMGECLNTPFTHCYVDSGKCSKQFVEKNEGGCSFTGTGHKSSDQFASGEVAYLLNGSSSTGVWKQTLTEDSHPNFTSDDAVYCGYISCDESIEATYTNDSNVYETRPKHTMLNGACTKCSYVACTHPSFSEGLCTECGIAGGYCGASTNNGGEESVIWVYDSDECTFSISGTGAMKDYASASETPWSTYATSIQSVTISEGVTSISAYAFSGCTALTSVTIPISVVSIGIDAFANAKALTAVTAPCGWAVNPLYTFDSTVTVTIADHSTGAEGDKVATCINGAYCGVCGNNYGDLNPNNHEENTYTNGFRDCCDEYQPAVLVTADNCTELNLTESHIDYYAIANEGQLLWYSANCGSYGAVLIADLQFGTAEEPWQNWNAINLGGVFDGNGHTVCLYTIYDEYTSGTAESRGVSLLGASGRTVKNLILGGYIKCNSTYRVGGVSHSGYGSVFENIISYMDVENLSSAPTGGIVGYFGNDGAGSTITNCAVYADISGTNCVGGLVGQGWAGWQYYSICNSAFYGTVTGGTYNGGLVGHSSTSSGASRVSITNCYYPDTLAGIGGVSATIGTDTSTAMTVDQFASGEVCYLLNGDQTTIVWKQTIAEGSLPGFTGSIVYYGYSSCTDTQMVYTNSTVYDNIPECFDSEDADHLCDFGCGKNADDGCHDVTTDGNHKCDECGAENATTCADSNNGKDHVCDSDSACTAYSTGDNAHADGDDADHLCDYGCGKQADNGCHDADNDGNHNCDECGTEIEDACRDSGKDHTCDTDSACTSYNTGDNEHADGDDANHLCDYGCGKEADNGCHDVDCDDNHTCDECGAENVTKCSDSTTDGDHKCDECGSIVTTCTDSGKDHICDSDSTCSVYSTGDNAHADGSDNNHTCDYCQEDIEGDICSDATNDGDHKCDECGYENITDCSDSNADGNHKCDECGSIATTCVDSSKDHVCDSDSACTVFSTGDNTCADSDSDNDHVCDYGCGKIFSSCNGGTATCVDLASCSVCGNTYGELNPNNHAKSTYTNGFRDCCGEYQPATLNGEVYEISNAGQLYWFAAQVNGGNNSISGKLTDNIVVNTGVLNADGTLNDDGANFRTWTPIGSSANPYTGTFDGDGKTISGLYFNSSTDNVGLFGVVNSYAKVQSVSIVDSYFSARDRIGGIVGYNSGTVSSCSSSATISGNDYIGGVVGYNPQYSSVTDCSNSGSINGNQYVGGVVGAMYSSTIEKCYNVGSVSGSYNVGGITGHQTGGTVKCCYNTATISGSNFVGGLVGYRITAGSNNSLYSCFNIGKVSGTEHDVVGSLIGYDSGTGASYYCYYLDGTAEVGINSTSEYDQGNKMTSEQFASGEVAYYLQKPLVSDDIQVWGQNIDNSNDKEAYPVFSDAKVYSGYAECGDETLSFSNYEVVTPHKEYSNGFCTACDGYQPAVWNDETNAYEISNAGQLYWYAWHIYETGYNYSAVLTEDIVVNTGVLNDDGTLKADPNDLRYWGGIYCDNENYFIFDGNNHTISGLYYDAFGDVETEYGYSGLGLFSTIFGGTVRNVGVVDSYFGAHHYVGGIAGKLSYGEIVNCYSSSTVAADSGVGGIAGVNYGGIIANCYNTGTVSGSSYVGSVAGYTDEDSVIKNSFYLTGCAVDGNTTVQFGIGAKETGTTTADVAGATTGYDDFTTGEVAYLLSKGCTISYTYMDEDGNTINWDCNYFGEVWGQTIGTDTHPVLGGKTVYYGYVSCADDAQMVYTNEATASDTKPGHNYGDLIPAQDEVHTATELKAGVAAHYQCSVCQKYFTSEKVETTLEALTGTTPSHSYGNWITNDDNNHWKQCSCGLKTEEGAHVYDNDQDATCNTCGHNRTVHNCSGTLVSGQAATCTVDGWKDYYKCSCGKFYADANCTAEITNLETWKTGDGKIAAGHTIAQGSAQEKTCTQDGWAAYEYCTECDYTTKVVIPAGHTLTDVEAKAKSCTESGYSAHKACSDCDYKEGYEVIPAGHSIEQGAAQEKTCTQDGWAAYEYCTECDYTTKVVIPAGHSYGDLIPAQTEVHTQTELKASVAAHYQCSVCQKYFTEGKVETTLEALTGTTPSHSYGNWITNNDSNHWKECSCGLKSEEGAHVYDNDQDATCNTCGHNRTVHNCSGTLVSGQAATCTVDGWKDYYKCSCGKFYADANCTAEITNLETWKTGAGKIVAGHNYGEPQFSWQLDYTSATITSTCPNCDEGTSGKSVSAECKITSQWDASTSTLTFTATAEILGQSYTDVQYIKFAMEEGRLTVEFSLLKENATAPMILVVAAYSDNGKMTGCQIVNEVIYTTEIDLNISGDSFRIFFLQPETYTPVMVSVTLG